jgi:ribosomal protein S27E
LDPGLIPVAKAARLSEYVRVGGGISVPGSGIVLGENSLMNSGHPGDGFGETSGRACRHCGGALRFEAGTSELRCSHCGGVSPISPSGEVAERDYAAHLEAAAGERETGEFFEAPCEKCGARTVIPEHEAAGSCPFCGWPMVYGYAARRMRPDALLPFALSRDLAVGRLRAWIAGLRFAPAGLGRHARIDDAVSGVYVPFYTYDVLTRTRYRGERGEYHYTTENRTFREGGRTVTRSQRVRHTRWSPVGGTVDLPFDDILVHAGKSLPARRADLIEPWDLAKLVPYSDDYLRGFRAEACRLGLGEGFALAREKAAPAVYSAVRKRIGGDEQRIHSAETEYFDITFKYILLPVWMSVFRFRGKSYPIFINARTGEVEGERPYSAWKIAGAAALALLVLILALAWLR